MIYLLLALVPVIFATVLVLATTRTAKVLMAKVVYGIVATLLGVQVALFVWILKPDPRPGSGWVVFGQILLSLVLQVFAMALTGSIWSGFHFHRWKQAGFDSHRVKQGLYSVFLALSMLPLWWFVLKYLFGFVLSDHSWARAIGRFLG